MSPRRSSRTDERTETLAVRAARGDRDALAGLFVLHHKRVLRFVLKHVSYDRAVADDVAGETWLAVAEKCDTYQADGRGGGWLAWVLTIARHKAMDAHRAQAKRSVVLSGDLDFGNGGAAAVSVSVERVLLDVERRADVAAAVQDLPLPQREAIVARYWLGLPWADVGALVGKTSGAVRADHYRALPRLRAQL